MVVVSKIAVGYLVGMVADMTGCSRDQHGVQTAIHLVALDG
jgi:hypothetical protein